MQPTGMDVLATFSPTLQSMPAEFPAGARLHTALAVGARDARPVDLEIAAPAQRLAGKTAVAQREPGETFHLFCARQDDPALTALAAPVEAVAA